MELVALSVSAFFAISKDYNASSATVFPPQCVSLNGGCYDSDNWELIEYLLC